VQAAHAAQVLVASPARGLAHHDWSPASVSDIPLHACSLAIERLVLEAKPARVRKCGASDCDVYYLDTSKSQLRQWCSMASCGNREKQRRWRAATG
jgi:predicted RNA-binding Zn ribbon-like protein